MLNNLKQIGGEFKKYGKYSKIVKKMVDDDYLPYVKKFYESLSIKNLKIIYIDNFWLALDEIKSSSKSIIATRIEIINQDHLYNINKKKCTCITENKICNNNTGEKYSSHAVSLFKNRKNGRIYMFDPNGKFNKELDQWLYKSRDGKYLLDSDNFSKHNQIVLPQYEGIQKHCKILKINKDFIDNAGYCMFYNYIGIAAVIDIVLKKKSGETIDITQIIQSISDCKNKKELYNIFPFDKNIGKVSLEIVSNIF